MQRANKILDISGFNLYWHLKVNKSTETRTRPIHVSLAYSGTLLMQVKKSIFNEDPPIKPPSMSAIAMSPAALAPFMLPPYWMRTAEATSAPTLSDTH